MQPLWDERGQLSICASGDRRAIEALRGEMGRAFSPHVSPGSCSWGDAPGWYGVAPLARKTRKARKSGIEGPKARLDTSLGHRLLPANSMDKQFNTFAGTQKHGDQCVQ